MREGTSANQSAPDQSIRELERLVAGCANLDRLLDLLSTELASLLPVSDRVSLVFLEPDGEWMRIYRLLPPVEGPRGALPRVRVDSTPVGQVVREGTGRVVADVRADPNITFGHASHDGIRSTISVPVRIAGRVVGAMNAGSRTVGACRAEMLSQLSAVAAIVAPAISAAEQALVAPAGLVASSAAFRSLLADARRAARSDANLLITGETGSGKTALARAVHEWSERSGRPFVTVHLADLSPTLVESELFGHERGAFTGASSGHTGRFESAHRGTLFLDEVSETPLPIQAKLLRVIQDGCFERVGGGRTVKADVRIIAATSRDLDASVERGEFRQDLYYRLNVVPLAVPPLRDRTEDLELLVESILAGFPGKRLAPVAWERLRAHSWPGNIRELESVLHRAAVLEERDQLELDGLPHPSAADEVPAVDDWPTLDEHQRRYVVRVLERRAGIIEGPGGAAHLLGLRPSTLRSLMKRLGVSARPMRERGRSQ